jgi:hypothetical protein
MRATGGDIFGFFMMVADSLHFCFCFVFVWAICVVLRGGLWRGAVRRYALVYEYEADGGGGGGCLYPDSLG